MSFEQRALIMYNNHHHYNLPVLSQEHGRLTFAVESRLRYEAAMKKYSKPEGLFELLGDMPELHVNFTGRNEYIDTINRHLQADGAGLVGSSIVGLGGIGKSQLIVKYITSLLSRETKKESSEEQIYRYIVWLRGSDSAIFEADMRTIMQSDFSQDCSRYKTTRELSACFYRTLEEWSGPKKILLVIDDGQWSDNIKDLLPMSRMISRFHWLISSREQENWNRYFSKKHLPLIKINVFTLDEAIAYFHVAFNSDVKKCLDYTQDNIELLANKLGRLPLALCQATANINDAMQKRQDLSPLTNYIEKVDRAWATLERVSKVNNYERTILTTWLVTVDKILDELPDAVESLLFCAYISGADISFKLLRAYWKDIQGDDVEIEERVNQQVDCLENYSLIDRLKDKASIRMHQLLQSSLKIWMKNSRHIIRVKQERNIVEQIESKARRVNVKKDTILLNALSTLVQYSKQLNPSMQDINRRKSLIPHMNAVLNVCNKSKSMSSALCQQQYNLMLNLSLIYSDIYAPKKVLHYIVPVLKYYRNQGFHDWQLAAYINTQANAEGYNGRVEQKRHLLKSLHNALENHYHSKSIFLLDTLINLANSYTKSFEAKTKVDYLEMAYEIFRENYPIRNKQHQVNIKFDINTKAIIQDNLACAYLQQGKLDDKCANLWLESLNIKIKYYGSDHWQAAITRGNYAMLLFKREKYKDALKQWELVLASHEKNYGEDHWMNIKTLINIFYTFARLRCHDKTDVALAKIIRLQDINNVFIFDENININHEYGTGMDLPPCHGGDIHSESVRSIISIDDEIHAEKKSQTLPKKSDCVWL